MSKKKNNKYTDDGRTISNMNIKGFKWYIPAHQKRKREELKSLKITKTERKAMIKGALLTIIPVAFALVCVFLVIFFIIYLWLL